MTIGILEKLELVKEHRGVAWFGAAKGAIVPICAFWTTHFDMKEVHKPSDLLKPQMGLLAFVVAACLMFSITTVWKWGRQSYGNWWQATWYVIGLEGMMIASPTLVLAGVALLLLIGINAIATACTLVAEGLPAIPAPPPTVTDVARARNLPRRKAAELVEQHRALSGKPVPT